MVDNLVIVESPAKAKTIEKFLGKDFKVVSSFGHIRDLSTKDFGVDIQNNFKPDYIVTPDKKKLVSELKKLVKDSKLVWLAADEDREGEAIAWHLYEVLNLKPNNCRRIVFHEITKEAILKAIETPRNIDINLVNAQQARRVLDRLVGFELSPVLWRKIKPSLSAGRVQSVAVRLIAEREKEITNFKSIASYKITSLFKTKDNAEFEAFLYNNKSDRKEAEEFLKTCQNAKFTVSEKTTKPTKKSPAPPFTTSTLQQEASRKLGFSVAQTMSVAQKLYEAGKITYMRTDSVNLSDLAINTAKQAIKDQFGDKYSKPRNFSTKAKGAQEAHEAIRPTYIANPAVDGTDQEQRLYDLIWKRTVASQMTEAEFEKTIAKIDISGSKEQLTVQGEVLIFDGFLKLYIESTDDENEDNASVRLPDLKKGDQLDLIEMKAHQKFSYHPPRYTEASLVKKMEELGIGRPSTYAPTISTIQKREYIVKETREGQQREVEIITLNSNGIKSITKIENFGAEKQKLFPTDIGVVVNDFLVEHFEDILNYDFTANVEEDFDSIANGKKEWQKMLNGFYQPFHENVENTIENADRAKGERFLGNHPDNGKPITVRIGRFGPMVQIGETITKEQEKEGIEKPQFASLLKGQQISSITLEEALDLFKLPRDLGLYEGKKVVAAIGRFGPYIRHDSAFTSLKKEDDVMSIDLNRAIELIEEKRKSDAEKFIKQFENEGIEVLNGRWGPYIKFQKKNYKIPKDVVAADLSLEQCQDLIKNPYTGKSSKKASPKKK
ncbi:MAG: type I DNA topoisomerase [Bacteroidales bacterium]|nr:type I DNA topoisomerase [Bacteroidales bacterium]